ncbi:hypothetical protein ELH77_19060 [Rhizobium ruizarguesonis]|uniref:hypothetical protein n=1 Tax=Rhizobium ruizarguesonis TaxID=2081791 RepID=UPI00102FF681|nr:hypothetical protein [Rhizobium ruizarguesonis]TAZ22183.1 hypothetical protein ELH77_19060 [Rhizobium ruizarguesonis]
MIQLRVLSLGAGVQSTTMALMAAHGEIGPMPDAAIFADTGAEPQPVYDHLAWLMSANVLPFPVHLVSAGNLRDAIMGRVDWKSGNDGRPPFYVINDKGGAGTLNRQCTRHFKIDPIRRKVRELLGLKRGQPGPKTAAAEQWIGISLDEAVRMKPSRDRYIENRWPLVEKRMTRRDCLTWLVGHGYPMPAKSACTFCPYRNDAGWRDLRDNDPASFSDAVAIDKVIRDGMPGVKRSQVFIHKSLKPLDAVDLSTAEERGQLNLFINECEGMCGV